jgi:polyisoprenoid-binding protein YceI
MRLNLSAVRAAAVAAAALPLLFAPPAQAQWQLDNEASDLRFVTTKNTNFAEVQQFKKMSGEITSAGAVSFTIDLRSVETQIPIRNERLQNLLFDVDQYPTATWTGFDEFSSLANLPIGASKDFEVNGKLTLHGKTQEAKASLRVVRLNEERLQVTTRAPILVSANQFDLVAGIEKLRELMGLPNIIGTVPVNFALTFKK